MKRPVAVILAIAILGAVAFCFLRPLPGDVLLIVEDKKDKVYTFTESQPFELSGKDAERIDVIYSRITSLGENVAIAMELRSADSRCYTFGSSVYINGEKNYDMELNDLERRYLYTEKYENGSWKACENGGYGMTYPNPYVRYVQWAFSSDDKILFHFPLNTDEPGRYRITFYFRDYIPVSSEDMRVGGSSGDGLYEASFEYDVPGRSLFSSEPRVGAFWMQDWTNDDSHYPDFEGNIAQTTLLITNWRMGHGYLQSEGSGLMRRTDSGEYVSDDTAVVGYALLENNYVNFPDRVYEHHVRPVTLNLMHWEYGAEYRLTLVFTENEDGTGEQRVLQLRLKFAEAEN